MSIQGPDFCSSLLWNLTTAAFWGGVVQKEEQRRNSVLADLLFISRSHPLAAFVFSFYDCYGHLEGRQRIEVMKKIPPAERYGFQVSGFSLHVLNVAVVCELKTVVSKEVELFSCATL
jgi:hypothetical protein